MLRSLCVLVVLLVGSLGVVTSVEPGAACTEQSPYHVEGLTFDSAYTVVVDYQNHTGHGAEAGYTCVGALLSYESHLAWGFHSDDNASGDDPRLEYWIADGMGPALESELKIDIAEDLVGYANTNGVSYTSNESLFHTGVHHETNHHFVMSAVDCYSPTWWGGWEWLWDGYATFSETIHNVSELHRPNSSFYENSRSANDYVANTNMALDALDHEIGLLHGYLYAHDGGMSFAHALAAAAHLDCEAGESLKRGVGYLDQALAASAGAHDTFENAFTDFALDVVKGENLSWGPPGADERDWALWLDPVNRTPWPNDLLSGTVNPWAFEAVDAPKVGGYQIGIKRTAGSGVAPFLLVRDGANWTQTAFTMSVMVPPGSHDDVAIVLVAPSLGPAGYALSRMS